MFTEIRIKKYKNGTLKIKKTRRQIEKEKFESYSKTLVFAIDSLVKNDKLELLNKLFNN